MEKFLLSKTPTAIHRVEVNNEQKSATLTLEITFDFTPYDLQMLTCFLQGLKGLTITRSTTGRSISMTTSTAYKLLNALTGKTERLIQEDAAQADQQGEH